MTLYADAGYPVPPAIDALHGEEIESFATAGTWGSAEQRTAIAATARKARSEAGLQDSIGDEELAESASLPDAARRLAQATALGATTIDRDYCKRVQAEGVTEGAYVEIASVASRITNLDVFARGIGVPSRPFCEPADAAAPSFERPSEAADEGFYTASVPNAPAGGALAKDLYGNMPAGNILRAVSLVPDEARRVIAVVGTQYFTPDRLMNFTDSEGHALTRAQIELVATKISEHNQCFY